MLGYRAVGGYRIDHDCVPKRMSWLVKIVCDEPNAMRSDLTNVDGQNQQLELFFWQYLE